MIYKKISMQPIHIAINIFIMIILINVTIELYTPLKTCLKFILMTAPSSFLRIDVVEEGTVTRFVVRDSPEKVTIPLPM